MFIKVWSGYFGAEFIIDETGIELHDVLEDEISFYRLPESAKDVIIQDLQDMAYEIYETSTQNETEEV